MLVYKSLATTLTWHCQVGPEEHVICALSGGVDSTVAATLVHKVLGDRLHCVFVDNGLLRYKVRGSTCFAIVTLYCHVMLNDIYVMSEPVGFCHISTRVYRVMSISSLHDGRGLAVAKHLVVSLVCRVVLEPNSFQESSQSRQEVHHSFWVAACAGCLCYRKANFDLLSSSKICVYNSFQNRQYCGTQEAERVMQTFKDKLHLPVTFVDDTETMMATLKVLPLTPTAFICCSSRFPPWVNHRAHCRGHTLHLLQTSHRNLDTHKLTLTPAFDLVPGLRHLHKQDDEIEMTERMTTTARFHEDHPCTIQPCKEKYSGHPNR